MTSGSPGSDALRLDSAGMTDEDIRTLLASVEPSPFIDRTPGTVAILRSRVEEAGGDPALVARWVEAQGGRVDFTQSFRQQGHGSRYGRKEAPSKEYYVVPVAALQG